MNKKKQFLSILMLSLGLASCKFYSDENISNDIGGNFDIDQNQNTDKPNTDKPIFVDPEDNPGSTPSDSGDNTPGSESGDKDNPGSGGGSSESGDNPKPEDGDNPGDSGGGTNPGGTGGGQSGDSEGDNPQPGSGENPGGSGGGSNPGTSDDTGGGGDNPQSGGGDNPGGSGSGDTPGESGESDSDPQPVEDVDPGESEDPIDNEIVLESKGEGFTYLNNNSEEIFIPWNDLVQSGNIVEDDGVDLLSVNFDDFGKGTLEIPTDYACRTSIDTKNINHLILGGPNLFKYKTLSELCSDTIRKITFKDGTTKINDKFCENLTNLREVVFPNSVTDIGERVFNGCTKLKTADLSNTSLKTIKPLLFNSCSSLTSASFPSTIDGEIGHKAFNNCTSLSTINLPNGVSSLTANDDGDSYAFNSCKKLKSITLNSSLKNVPTSAFNDCVICEFTINTKLENIGYYAFKNCYKLSNIDLSNAKSIGAQAFSETKVSDASFNNYTDKVIGAFSFYKTNVENLFFSSKVETIGDKAFYENPNLKSAKSQSNVLIKSIGSEAFYNCPLLDDVNFLSNAVNIGSGAFENCGTITTDGILTLEAQQINSSAFANTKLKEVTYTNPNNASGFIGSAHFKNCKELTKFSYTDSVLEFSSLPSVEAFDGCENLEELVLISQYNNSDNRGLALNVGVSKIQEADNMFRGCNKLKKITFSGTIDNWLKSTYYKDSATSTIQFRSNIGSAVDLRNNEELQVICQKGRSTNTSSSITLNKNNVSSYLNSILG